MEESRVNSEVIIVGAGPVGLMLACELRLQGVETTIVERLEEPTGQSKANGVSIRSLELFELRGMLDKLLERAPTVPYMQFSGLVIDLANLDTTQKHALVIRQPDVEDVLTERALESGVRFLRGHEVVRLSQDEDGVRVGVVSGAGEEKELSCEYLVGCDGGGSTIRKLTGTGFPGTNSTIKAYVSDVNVNYEFDGVYLPQMHPRGVIGLVPIYDDVFRFTVIEFGSTIDENEPISENEVFAAARRITGGEVPDVKKFLWISRFGNSTRIVEDYRTGRILLAGDSAHIHFPFAGQGMNTGLHEAVNLGWKLAAAVHGWAPAGLLDTYHSERHPAATRMCKNTLVQFSLMYPPETADPLREMLTDLLAYQEVNDYFAKMINGLDARYPIPGGELGADHPLIGLRLAETALDGPDGPSSVFRALGSGRGVLLSLGADAVDLEEVSGWLDRVDIVHADLVPQIDAAVVLLRPDGHVAWADRLPVDSKNLRTALQLWFGEPQQSAVASASREAVSTVG